jgi:hypothetical protein
MSIGGLFDILFLDFPVQQRGTLAFVPTQEMRYAEEGLLFQSTTVQLQLPASDRGI